MCHGWHVGFAFKQSIARAFKATFTTIQAVKSMGFVKDDSS